VAFNILQLTADGEGHGIFNLGEIQIELVTRFNYSAEAWMMDILNSDGIAILNGLVLVPGVDILKPYLEIKAQLGSLVPVCLNPEDYKNPDMLGTNVQLLWYPVGTAVVLP
jgi:hypothetical protein